MKFFSAALSAAAIGSAIATPILGSSCGGHGAAPSGINGLPSGIDSPLNGDELQSASPVQTLTSATTLYQTWATTVSDSKTHYYEPEITYPTGIGSGATSGKAPAVIVKEVTTIVLNIDVLVKADLTRITELVDCETGIDAHLLLEALVSLSGHLHTVVTGVIPSITALIRPSVGLVAAELQIVLDLVADIEALLIQVEGCLKHLVATATHDVLKVIIKELNLVAGLILPIATPIVNFALRAVVGLDLQAPHLVAQIHAHAQAINKCAGGLHVFLGAALKIAL
ncbi:hypothetical protein SMACR_06678 [Sordaria macrospora]|uniref:WGS project CABT00000000 data, contig 2.13 n=2 Tax=Sordaria macrospora TaxID=5147 RepID=F7VYB2_SORMK|nr:uncharacterized protein SMAC_06678 [Sordaria macrospora k-hell]KAA8632560.1 hypothetical protein SMACR_06678 [Sordaria macrospora]KAH7631632.1 hypothetical protein B0T09DRAFT_303209 [Sordaria sp. MPI-SDFR-AT-0083]WPJ62946.1 hypothetical protein SMAC4_06678 [Sordaria macrospora]CCC10506.1 unnamed protein product [Sordaria macrospora k-hell]